MDFNNPVSVGIIVPTLGTRQKTIEDTLRSIRCSSNSLIYVVSPNLDDVKYLKDLELCDETLLDPGRGLPDAINYGINALPNSVLYVSWLGDDDLLAGSAIDLVLEQLEKNSDCVGVYGSCEYIDVNGQSIGINRFGKLANAVLHFGPCLVPQPGMLFRRSTFNQVGGLNSSYRMAFDLDLLLKIKREGKLQYIPFLVSKFRWHNDSLSVRQRLEASKEASRIRKKYLPKMLRPISPLWEIPLTTANYFAGFLVTMRARKI
jgi:hypothetical protein